MFILNGKRLDINKPFKDNAGVVYTSLLSPASREGIGVIEIPDPVPPADFDVDYYDVIETELAPYVEYKKKTQEEIDLIRWRKIQVIRDDLIENGGCFVADKWFHSDVKSKQQQLTLERMGTNLYPDIPWTTMDGSEITLTPELITQVVNAQILREITIFAYAKSLKANSSADIKIGWPDRYVKT